MKKGDIIIVVLLAVIAITGSVYTFMRGANTGDKYVVISHDQEELYNIKINDNYENTIHYDVDGEHNEIIIKNGEVWIETANCNNQVCVKEKPISRPGQVIVCLPHKLIVEIKGKTEESIDIISE